MLHAIVPIHSRDAAKSRLGSALDAEERDVLVLGMLARTIRVLDAWSACLVIHVVAADTSLGTSVGSLSAKVRTLVDAPGGDLNGALRQGRDAAVAEGATAVLMLPADLPLLSATSLERLLDAADATLAAGNGRPMVAIAAADARGGTNALLLSPADVIEPHFGNASFEAHLRAAAAAEASVQAFDDALLGFDLDTPEDLERLPLETQLDLQREGELLATALAVELF